MVKKAETLEDYQLSIDLENQKITDEYGFELNFPVDAFRKYCLLNGLDDIGLSLQNAEEISKYEKNRPGWKNF